MNGSLSQSFRWKSSAVYDVDAYVVDSDKWILFAYVKVQTDWPALQEKLKQEFHLGDVISVGGALKTKTSSVPMPVDCVQKEFWTSENGAFFRLELCDVLNPGLYLDQKLNRKYLFDWIRTHPNEKISVLNLFSYTGSFSVAASVAGAKETTSVDLSGRYLKWEKANHDKNASSCQHRFIKEDSRVFLKRACSRHASYQVIIIDPPTFSKSARGIFEVRKEMPLMLEMAAGCLSPGGIILASTNDAGWPSTDFFKMIQEFSSRHKLKFEKGQLPKEFEIINHSLKSVWLQNQV